jgi:hypothetical protein
MHGPPAAGRPAVRLGEFRLAESESAAQLEVSVSLSSCRSGPAAALTAGGATPTESAGQSPVVTVTVGDCAVRASDDGGLQTRRAVAGIVIRVGLQDNLKFKLWLRLPVKRYRGA